VTKILLIYDVPNWAWGFRAHDLQRFAPDGFEVETVDYTTLAAKYPPERIRDYCVFNFSWTMCPMNLVMYAKRNVALITCGGLLYDRQREGDWRSRVVTSSRNTKRAKERLPNFDGLIAVNQEVCEAATRHNPNTVRIPSGVNTDFWCHRPMREYDGRLRVGWSGQRRCNVKGLNQILKPLVDRCPQYDWRVNDRNFNEAMSHQEMRDWYHDVDVFVSTSIIEGTPSPPFEAASCGRIVLSTDVGVVADWDYLGQRDLRAPAYRNQGEADKTVNWFVAKLAELAKYAESDRLPKIGELLRQSVEANYSYDKAGIARKYLEFIADGTEN